ncbi:unnamed protein product [Protopolystoma xenopodis]|uniref:Uncharacterized protein n=1 Tax=Protopolystoma xenopodis TaxID=117903 RepID=A0A3S5BET8_9PLAT|nr:unnamed protein product [Protopolystoma xenopodis]
MSIFLALLFKTPKSFDEDFEEGAEYLMDCIGRRYQLLNGESQPSESIGKS